MPTSRRTLIALAIAIAVAAATAAIALGGGTAGPPRPAIVSSHGLRTGTVLGSFCGSGTASDGTQVGLCGDAAFPLHPRTYLPITPGGTVRANLRKRAKSVTASLIRVQGDDGDYVGGDVTAKPVRGKHKRLWRLSLPDDLGGATALSIETQFRGGGDADFWAGVKPVTRWP